MTVKDRVCVALPLFHCFGLSANLLGCLHSGSASVFLPGRHSGDILGVIKRWRCTILNAVPTLLLSIAGRPDVDTWDISSLRAGILGGDGLSEEQYHTLCARLDMRILSSLGQTEATAGITMVDYDSPQQVNATTVGRFLPYVEGVTAKLGRFPFHSIKIAVDCASVGLAAVISLISLYRLEGVREGTVIAAVVTGKVMAVISRRLRPALESLWADPVEEAGVSAEEPA